MRKHATVALLLSLQAGLLPLAVFASGDTPPTSSAAKDEDEKYMAQLAEADQLIRAKQPAEAIAKTLDPVIAHYEASYANSPKKIYCSRSPEEALMYMMASAVAKQSALALGSTWADAYHMKSYALIELGAVVAARDALLKAVALSPQNALYLGELGYTYQADKSWELALETFKRAEQAAHLSPKDQRISEETRALRGEGYVLVELGQLDEAAVAYRKALTLNPDDRQSKAELGYIDSLKAKRAAADAPAAR